MCMIVDRNTAATVAEHDITVYKLFFVKTSMEDTLQTPYRHKDFTREQTTFKSRLVKHCSYMGPIPEIHCEVNEGLHSFASLASARRIAETIAFAHRRDVVIVPMLIPEGAEYYVGTFKSEISYASDTLTWQSHDEEARIGIVCVDAYAYRR